MSEIWLSSPTTHGDAEIKYISEAFEKNWIAPLGTNVDEFESAVANYVGAKHAVALNSGTAAIHLALKCAGVGKEDTVICQDLTFAATCNPVLYQGAVPVFIDSEKDTWNMDPVLLRNALERYPEAKAVLVVNLYGTPAKLDIIAEICREFNVPLIEDAAESLGSIYKKKQTGTYGDYGVFSFNGNKIITTSGGGMLICSRREDAEKARFWSAQSREKQRHYEHREVGYNYRMSNILAGIGRGQMEYIDEHIRLKRNIYRIYQAAFQDVKGVELNPVPPEAVSNCWLSCLYLKTELKKKPLEVIEALEKEHMEARPIWKPMHLQPIFANYSMITAEGESTTQSVHKSISEEIYNKGLCLPSDIKMRSEDMESVIGTIMQCFQG